MRSALKLIGYVFLAACPGFASINVAAKASGASSPIALAATASSSNAITGWTIYVDSSLVFRQNTSATSISQSVSMSTGTHTVVMKAWDATGANGSASLTVNVAGSGGGGGVGGGGLIPSPPSSAQVYSNVDEMSGWHGCSACANGTTGTFWFKQGVTNPAIDGKSMQTYLKGGYNLWADNLFVRKFGNQNWANHVIWSITFQWNAPKTKQPNGRYVAQAMEFDAYFSTHGFKYLWGTQCDYGGGHWDIWNNTKHYWQHTAVACQKWAPGTWHTVKWYLERDPNKKYLHYAVLQVDGTQYNINTWLPAMATSWGDDFGIQFEQDTDLYGDPWYMWADKIHATIW